MNQINKHRYELTSRDFRSLGAHVERILEGLVKHDYGYYQIDNDDLNVKLALKVIQGMEGWQKKYNKGIELVGTFNHSLHIYNKEEKQSRLDEAMNKFEY